MRNLAKLILMI